jgi:hypothetical protein
MKMSESPPRAEENDPVENRESVEVPIVIAVVRSGGTAGIRRQWRVEPKPADAPEWITMIERCPWGGTTEAVSGADRFIWVIRVRTPAEQREQELSDAALDGPWRALVDAVRAASA